MNLFCKNKNKNNSGFTIIELLVVIVVIGILATIIVVAYNGIQKRANQTVVLSAITQQKKQLELYKVEYGSYPTYTICDSDPTIKACPKNTDNGIFYFYHYGPGAMTYSLVASYNSEAAVTTDRNSPEIDTSSKVRWGSVSVNEFRSCALSYNGTAYCWGKGLNALPTAIDTNQRFSSISTGINYTCAINAVGKAYCWGANTNGQLGIGSYSKKTTPYPVSLPSDKKIKTIYSGASSVCAISTDNYLYCWGTDTNGQLGFSNTGERNSPELVTSSIKFRDTSLSSTAQCAIDISGNHWCSGKNDYQMFGDGTTNSSNTFVTPASPIGINFTSITAGLYHICSLSSGGLGYCWGYNTFGQLGSSNDIVAANLPKQVDMSNTGVFSQISSGYYHTCAVALINSGVYCWGYNANNELGTGDSSTYSKKNIPTITSDPQSGESLVFVSSGTNHSCALELYGSIYCWGHNNYNQTADSTNANTPKPKKLNDVIK